MSAAADLARIRWNKTPKAGRSEAARRAAKAKWAKYYAKHRGK